MNYSLYKDGVLVGPSFVMGQDSEGIYMSDGEDYDLVPHIANGNECNRSEYFKFLPEMNLKFREKYRYLDSFLDSDEYDDVYLMNNSDINFDTNILE